VRRAIENVLPWTLDVHEASGSTDGGVSITAHDSGEVVLRAEVAWADGDLRLRIDDIGPMDPGCRAADVATVLVVVGHRLADASTQRLVLETREPIFRAQARRLGFAGSLREPLTRTPWTTSGASIDPDDPDDPDDPTDPDEPDEPDDRADGADAIAARLGAHLPAVAVVPSPSSRRARLAKRAASGVAAPVELEVQGPGQQPLRLLVGDRPDLMLEPVAEAVDTALRFRQAIGPLGSRIRRIDFAVPDHQLRTGRYRGTLQSEVGTVIITADLIAWDDLASFRRRPAPARAGGSAPVPAPGTIVDGLTAHLCGRLVDDALLAEDRHRHTEVRRRLGEHLGVATLEHAIHPRPRGDPEVQQRAHDRLATEASALAATSVAAAMGELFVLWWFRPDAPTPLVTCFAKVVDDLYR